MAVNLIVITNFFESYGSLPREKRIYAYSHTQILTKFREIHGPNHGPQVQRSKAKDTYPTPS